MVTEMEDFDPAFVGGFRENHATIYPVVNTDSLSTFLGEFQTIHKRVGGPKKLNCRELDGSSCDLRRWVRHQSSLGSSRGSGCGLNWSIPSVKLRSDITVVVSGHGQCGFYLKTPYAVLRCTTWLSAFWTTCQKMRYEQPRSQCVDLA